MKIKLIIFDLWQTLIYRDVKVRASLEMYQKSHVKISYSRFVKLFESSLQTKKWKSKYAAYENFCKNLKLPLTKENVNLFMNIRDKAEKNTKTYPHSIKTLKSLKKQGYKIGLISNSSVFAIPSIKKSNLLKYIDYPLFSYYVKVIKPNLKFFKKMLKISKCKPEESIMIGDKLEDDVIPPRKIGMNSIHYKNYEKLKKDLKKFNVNI